jgi:hypothetical protein
VEDKDSGAYYFITIYILEMKKRILKPVPNNIKIKPQTEKEEETDNYFVGGSAAKFPINSGDVLMKGERLSYTTAGPL